MIAIDTNVLVRIATLDDPDQAERAQRMLDGNIVWVSRTVLIELVWVLSSKKYACDRSAIIAFLHALTKADDVRLEDSDRVTVAIGWYERGFDFADALHLAASHGVDHFATFDEQFAKDAALARTAPPVQQI